MRIMALDIGEAKVGIALSDPTKTLATPHKVIERSDDASFLSELKKEIDVNQVEKIIVGLPYNLNRSSSAQTKKVEELADYMKKNIDMPIEFLDERLTTKLAETIMLEADLSRKKRKQKIDKLSAALILQTYLDLKGHA